MQRLLIATTNPGKLAEIKFFLKDLPLELVSLSDLGIKDKVAEDGKTFKENAIKKAKFYCQKSQLPTIADDGGLEIDVLNGEPGVKSRRWIKGKEATDEELINYTLKKLKGVPLEKRGAQLRTVSALVLPDGRIYISEGKVRGIIAKKPHPGRTAGFPFRSLLFLPEIGKFYSKRAKTTSLLVDETVSITARSAYKAEKRTTASAVGIYHKDDLTPEENFKYNHRFKALKKIKRIILQNLLK